VPGLWGQPVRISTSSHVRGQNVLALGSPKGLQGSVSRGIISNFGTRSTKENYKIKTIQTDAAINNGNSGGGLFLVKTGELIGINSFVMKDTVGVNFAIDISELQGLPATDTWQQVQD
jgi:S1-C subfamily serine protease